MLIKFHFFTGPIV